MNKQGENNPFYGRIHTEESKKKIGESSKKRNIRNVIRKYIQ